MDKKIKDTGTILVLLECFEKQHLPAMINIKKKLSAGKDINEHEIEHLGKSLHKASMLLPYMDRYPEYKLLIAKIIQYNTEVVAEALANETF